MDQKLQTVVDNSKNIFTIEFSLQNVSEFPKEEYFYSPEYTVKNLSWKAQVKKTADNKLAIYASSTPCSESSVLWSCSALIRFTLVSFKSSPREDHSMGGKVLYTSKSNVYGYKSLMDWSSVISSESEFVQNDSIKLRVYIEADAPKNMSLNPNVGGRDQNCKSTPLKTIDENEIASENETVSDTIRKSFGNQENSDFKFIVGEKEIYVHKTILKLRSQYFERMFQEHWQEGIKNSAEIDENYEALVAFLKYLYTDELEVDAKVALGVSVIADKYCKSNLVDICLRQFKKGLDDVNVAELYEIALENELPNFSELCIDFACHNVEAIISSEGFHTWNVDTYRSFFKHHKIKQACKNKGT